MKLTILAIDRERGLISPKTKKNSPRIVPGMKHPILLPSKAYVEWERAAIKTWLGEGFIKRIPGDDKAYHVTGVKPIAVPVNCRALIYRDALRGDAVGFYQAIGDFLQLAGVVVDDKFIVSWDGSRLLKDSVKPRVELELTRIGDCVQGELFEGSED